MTEYYKVTEIRQHPEIERVAQVLYENGQTRNVALDAHLDSIPQVRKDDTLSGLLSDDDDGVRRLPPQALQQVNANIDKLNEQAQQAQQRRQNEGNQ